MHTYTTSPYAAPLYVGERINADQIYDADGHCIGSMDTAEQAAALVRAANLLPELVTALEALLRNLSNIEVLGEWEALEINPCSASKLRPKVDAVIAQAHAALARARDGKEQP